MAIEDNIAFVGLGAMGYGMAGNVRRHMVSKATLFIYDVVRETCERFVREFGDIGPIDIVAAPKTAVDQSSTLITSIPTGANVREVYLESDGAVIHASKRDRIIVECSTVDVKTTREVGRQIMDAGLGHYVDAPVSGGPIGAAKGTLSMLLGHADDHSLVADRARSVATLMADPNKIVFCGQLGNGLAAKIVNNYLSFCNLLTIAEGMSIGLRLGVDKEVLFKCISNSGGNSATFHNFQPCPGLIPHLPSSNGFKAGFRPLMVVKDLDLGVQAGEEAGVDATMGSNALQTFRKATVDPRCKDRDASSIWLMINGLEPVD